MAADALPDPGEAMDVLARIDSEDLEARAAGPELRESGIGAPESHRPESLRGLAELTQLVEAAQGDGAARLAEDIRSTSTVELLVALLDDKEAAIHLRALIILVNLLSDAFEPKAFETKALLRPYRLPARVSKYLKSNDTRTVLYSVTLLQNACSDPVIARQVAEDKQARKRLELLLESPDAQVVKSAAGALTNVRAAVTAGPQPNIKRVGMGRFGNLAGSPARVPISNKAAAILARIDGTGEGDMEVGGNGPAEAGVEPGAQSDVGGQGETEDLGGPRSGAEMGPQVAAEAMGESEAQGGVGAEEIKPGSLREKEEAASLRQSKGMESGRERKTATVSARVHLSTPHASPALTPAADVRPAPEQAEGEEATALKEGEEEGAAGVAAAVPTAPGTTPDDEDLTDTPKKGEAAATASEQQEGAAKHSNHRATTVAPVMTPNEEEWADTPAVLALRALMAGTSRATIDSIPATKGGVATAAATAVPVQVVWSGAPERVDAAATASVRGLAATAVAAQSPVGAAGGGDSEWAELNSLGARLASAAEEEIEDALAVLGEMVGRADGERGLGLGEAVRSLDLLASVGSLLAHEAEGIIKQALYILGNLCSDAVDPHSSLSKTALLQCGTEDRLLPLLYCPDDELLIYACAALQNLCRDANWSAALARHNTVPQLEALAQHENDTISRYAAGALRNMQATVAVTVNSPAARAAVQRRSAQARAEALGRRRAARVIERAWRAHRRRRAGEGNAVGGTAAVAGAEGEAGLPKNRTPGTENKTQAGGTHFLRQAKEKAQLEREERRRQIHAEKLRTFLAARTLQRAWLHEPLHAGPMAEPFWRQPAGRGWETSDKARALTERVASRQASRPASSSRRPSSRPASSAISRAKGSSLAGAGGRETALEEERSQGLGAKGAMAEERKTEEVRPGEVARAAKASRRERTMGEGAMEEEEAGDAVAQVASAVVDAAIQTAIEAAAIKATNRVGAAGESTAGEAATTQQLARGGALGDVVAEVSAAIAEAAVHPVIEAAAAIEVVALETGARAAAERQAATTAIEPAAEMAAIEEAAAAVATAKEAAAQAEAAAAAAAEETAAALAEAAAIETAKEAAAAAAAEAAAALAAAAAISASAAIAIRSRARVLLSKNRARAAAAARAEEEERAVKRAWAVVVLQKNARRRVAVIAAERARDGMRRERAAQVAQAHARGRAGRRRAAAEREARRPRGVGASVLASADGGFRLQLRLLSADETEQRAAAELAEALRESGRRSLAERALAHKLERQAELAWAQARARNDAISERERAAAAAAAAAAKREADLRAKEEARVRREQRRIARERHRAAVAIQIRVRFKIRHRRFLEARQRAAERAKEEQLSRLLHSAAARRMQRQTRIFLERRMRERCDAPARVVQRFGRGMLTRRRVARMRVRTSRRRRELDLRMRINLGKTDVNKSVEWSTYALDKKRKAAAEENLWRLGGGGAGTRGSALLIGEGMEGGALPSPPDVTPRGALSPCGMRRPRRAPSPHLGSSSPQRSPASPTSRAELLRMAKSERAAAVGRPYEQTLSTPASRGALPYEQAPSPPRGTYIIESPAFRGAELYEQQVLSPPRNVHILEPALSPPASKGTHSFELGLSSPAPRSTNPYGQVLSVPSSRGAHPYEQALSPPRNTHPYDQALSAPASRGTHTGLKLPPIALGQLAAEARVGAGGWSEMGAKRAPPHTARRSSTSDAEGVRGRAGQPVRTMIDPPRVGWQ